MKRKYLFNHNYFLDEERFLELLENYSQKGYKLKKAGFYFLRFEKSDTPTYYQIDYNHLTKEYMEIIEEMGYTFIDNYGKIYIFETTNPNAIPLQSDEEAKKLVLLDTYKISTIIILLLCAFLWYAIFKNDYIFRNLLLSPGEFYLNYLAYIFKPVSILLPLQFILEAISQALSRYFIKKDNPKHPILNKFNKIYKIMLSILCIMTFLVSIAFLTTLTSFKPLFYLVALSVIYELLRHLALRYVPRIATKEKRFFTQAIILIIYFMVALPLMDQLNHEPKNIMPNDFETYYTYDSNSYKYEKNIFLNATYISDQDTFEHIYHCRNEHIAIEVLENLIQKDERMWRLRHHEFELDFSFATIIGLNSQPFKEFEDILPLLEKIDFKDLDDCYWYDENIYMRKDCQILCASLKELDQAQITGLYNFYFQN